MTTKVLVKLLEEEEDDDLLLCYMLQKKQRRSTSSIFKTRREEEFFCLLIKNHLSLEEDKFRSYFRSNKKQFDYVLSLIDKDVQTKGDITPQEKLSLTLR